MVVIGFYTLLELNQTMTTKVFSPKASNGPPSLCYVHTVLLQMSDVIYTNCSDSDVGFFSVTVKSVF